MSPGVGAEYLNFAATGNITSANVLTKPEEVLDEWGEAYEDKEGIMKVSPKVFKYYARMTEAIAGRSLSFEELSSGKIQLRGSNVKLVKVNELAPIGGIEPIILTPTGNFIAGTDSVAELNQFDFEKNHRMIDIMLDGKWGVDYALANADNSPIVTNDAFA